MNSAYDLRFAYTGRELADEAGEGTYYYRRRFYDALNGLYGDYGHIHKSIEIQKVSYRAAYELGDGSHFLVALGLAGSYYKLGMIADGDRFLEIGMAPLEDQFDQFMEHAFALEGAGEIEPLRTLMEEVLPNLDLSLQPDWQKLDVGRLHIAVGDYETGIALMEVPFDVMSLELMDYNDPLVAIPVLQTLAFAYHEIGQTNESELLLAALQARLTQLSDSGIALPGFFAAMALNRGLLGNEDGARQYFKTAVAAGFRDYYGIINSPTWSSTLELPGFAELLDEMKQDLDRQRATVEQADAEDNFRAEIQN